MKRNPLLFLVALLPMMASAYDAKIDDIYYSFSGNEATVTYQSYGYAGWFSDYSGNIVIPKSVTYNGNSYKVTCIGAGALSRSNLTSVSIPESVTSIGSYAFQNCSSLTSITIPENVTCIGEGAFDGTLWYNNQPDGLVYAGRFAYKYKGYMQIGTQITIKAGTVGIVPRAFSDCNGLTSITIPEGLTSIGSSAFSGCSGLTYITIPNSVATIERNAFYGTAWYDGQPEGLVYAGKVAYMYKGTMPSGTQIIIEDGTLGIADEAFNKCAGLASITIPNSVTNIGADAFYGCSNLTSVIIPNSVTSIGRYAFRYCGLTSVTIGNGVANIDEYAFDDCNRLEKVVVPDIAAWCRISFGSYESNPLYYANHIYSDEDTEITELSIPQNITSIGNYAFYSCCGLKSVTIPNSVTSIGNGSFYGNISLTSINIPDKVTNIGSYAFSGCGGLTSINIPKGMTCIGGYAFSGCKLRNVLMKCVTPPTGSESAFSEQTYYHTTLYIPTGSWDAYAYDDYWYKFHNIRETATAEEQISMRQAYMLMDACTFAYSVYDPVNDEIGTISSVGIDENNPNHSWQVIEADGSRYLYNVGAKKFVVASASGSFSLSDVPASITMEDGDNGIIFGTQAARQWALVSNESMSVEQAVIDGIDLNPALSEGEGDWYSLDGRKMVNGKLSNGKLPRGINIVRYSDGTTRKILKR